MKLFSDNEVHHFYFDTSNFGDFKIFTPHKYTCIISQLSFCINFVLNCQHELNYHENLNFEDFLFWPPKLACSQNYLGFYDKGFYMLPEEERKVAFSQKVLQSSNFNQFTEAIGILYFNHKWLFLGLKISLSCKTPTFKS